jgi:hypothetical protein
MESVFAEKDGRHGTLEAARIPCFGYSASELDARFIF